MDKDNYLTEIKNLRYIDSQELKYYLITLLSNGTQMMLVEGEQTPQKAVETVLQQRGYIVRQTFQGHHRNFVYKANSEADLLNIVARVKIKATLLDKRTGKPTNRSSYYYYNS